MTTTDRYRQGGRPPLLLFVFALLMLASGGVCFAATASTAAPGPGWGACFDCHDDSSLSLTTAKGEELSLTVTAADLAGSPHRGLECQACHPGVDLDTHPTGDAIPSLEKFRVSSSRVCFTCHPTERLRARSQHAAIVFEDQSLSCVECHGSHGVRSVAAWKQAAGANEYCLICHSRAISIRRPDGATLSLAVDVEKLKASVHPDHDCTDCHSAFSTSAHPAGQAGNRNRRTVAAARTCAQCHEDKLRQAEGSIHFTLLRSGSGEAPGCTSCHSAHEVAPKERYATITGSPCRACHQQIFQAYTGSMHGVARASGDHLNAPMCSECHRAHDVQGTANPEKVRAACIGCHPTAEALHAVWLPNANLHLKAVSCAACHAPLAQRVVALRVVEEGSGRQLTEREVGDLLGGDVAAAIDSAKGSESGLNLWTALRRLESRRLASAAKLDIVGRLEIARGLDAHRLADKSGAVRDCESCHTKGSQVFDQVALSLARDDGRPKRFEGDQAMLTDAASIVSVHGFYALGGTRIGVLDWLLAMAVAGGLMVVALHLTFRIRAARAHKEG
jgi:hypothetical protein